MDDRLSNDRLARQTQLGERVRQYASRIVEFTRPTYNETEVRVDFVNPLFRCLGWDVDNEAGLPQHLREVTHLCHGNRGQRSIELVRSDVLRGQLLYLCGNRRNGRGVQLTNGSLGDFCLRDSRVLNVCGLNRRHLHLQAAH